VRLVMWVAGGFCLVVRGGCVWGGGLGSGVGVSEGGGGEEWVFGGVLCVGNLLEGGGFV